MKNIFMFSILTFALAGLIVPSLMLDSFAGTENSGREKGTKTANGCEKGTAKNNPNCDDGGNEPPTVPTQFTNCDIDPLDGQVSASELQSRVNNDPNSTVLISIVVAQSWIDLVSEDGDDVLNTSGEIRKINRILNEYDVSPCS